MPLPIKEERVVRWVAATIGTDEGVKRYTSKEWLFGYVAKVLCRSEHVGEEGVVDAKKLTTELVDYLLDHLQDATRPTVAHLLDNLTIDDIKKKGKSKKRKRDRSRSPERQRRKHRSQSCEDGEEKKPALQSRRDRELLKHQRELEKEEARKRYEALRKSIPTMEELGSLTTDMVERLWGKVEEQREVWKKYGSSKLSAFLKKFRQGDIENDLCDEARYYLKFKKQMPKIDLGDDIEDDLKEYEGRWFYGRTGAYTLELTRDDDGEHCLFYSERRKMLVEGQLVPAADGPPPPPEFPTPDWSATLNKGCVWIKKEEAHDGSMIVIKSVYKPYPETHTRSPVLVAYPKRQPGEADELLGDEEDSEEQDTKAVDKIVEEAERMPSEDPTPPPPPPPPPQQGYMPYSYAGYYPPQAGVAPHVDPAAPQAVPQPYPVMPQHPPMPVPEQVLAPIPVPMPMPVQTTEKPAEVKPGLSLKRIAVDDGPVEAPKSLPEEKPAFIAFSLSSANRKITHNAGFEGEESEDDEEEEVKKLIEGAAGEGEEREKERERERKGKKESERERELRENRDRRDRDRDRRDRDRDRRVRDKRDYRDRDRDRDRRSYRDRDSDRNRRDRRESRRRRRSTSSSSSTSSSHSRRRRRKSSTPPRRRRR